MLDPSPPPLTQRTWFIALMLFCFFPVGLYLTWANPAWSQRAKGIITGVVGVLVLLAYLKPDSNKANDKPVAIVKVDPATGALKPVAPPSTAPKVVKIAPAPVPKPKATQKPLFVKAVTLFDAYADNAIKADDDYKGKDVIVEGYVGYMDASLGTPAVHLIGNESEPHVHCVMKDDSATRADLAKLHTGKVAFIRGKFAGRFLGIIGLTEGEVAVAPAAGTLKPVLPPVKPGGASDQASVHTPAENLAIIDGNPANATAYAEALKRLHEEYGDRENRIADATANVWEMLRKKGKPRSCLDILVQMQNAFVPGANQSYIDMITAWVMIETGSSGG